MAADLKLVPLGELNEAALVLHRPRLILCPLVTARFDCMDVAGVLAELGHRGPLRAVTRKLPNPDVVRREVRGHFAEIDFDLIIATDEGMPPV